MDVALGQVPSMRTSRAGHGVSGPRVNLVSEFQLLVEGRQVSVAHGVQRLIAFLALAPSPVARSRVAGQLWLDVPEWRALGNLRSALWRLRRLRWPIVRSIDERLTLDPAVEVDLAELSRLTQRLVSEPGASVLASLPQLIAATEVLPGWEDDWIVVERERFRELRLVALEGASQALLDAGNMPAALQAAMAAVSTEPLRDTAQRLLVRAHLSEGNKAAALRTFYAYRDLLEAELGVEPSDAMSRLISELGTRHLALRGDARVTGRP